MRYIFVLKDETTTITKLDNISNALKSIDKLDYNKGANLNILNIDLETTIDNDNSRDLSLLDNTVNSKLSKGDKSPTIIKNNIFRRISFDLEATVFNNHVISQFVNRSGFLIIMDSDSTNSEILVLDNISLKKVIFSINDNNKYLSVKGRFLNSIIIDITQEGIRVIDEGVNSYYKDALKCKSK